MNCTGHVAVAAAWLQQWHGACGQTKHESPRPTHLKWPRPWRSVTLLPRIPSYCTPMPTCSLCILVHRGPDMSLGLPNNPSEHALGPIYTFTARNGNVHPNDATHWFATAPRRPAREAHWAWPGNANSQSCANMPPCATRRLANKCGHPKLRCVVGKCIIRQA